MTEEPTDAGTETEENRGTEPTAGSDGAPADDRATVLVVDDEPRVCEAFELWLKDDYRVVTATSGEDALDLLDARVEVVLLDRHMPGLSGDEVLERIRDSAHDCRVAMVTAIDPDFDIVEMPFDHYVSKPVGGAEVKEVVERLLGMERYDRRVNDLYAVTQKIATLEAEKTRTQLSGSEEYATLVERKESLQAETDDVVASLDADGVEQLFERAVGADEE